MINYAALIDILGMTIMQTPQQILSALDNGKIELDCRYKLIKEAIEEKRVLPVSKQVFQLEVNSLLSLICKAYALAADVSYMMARELSETEFEHTVQAQLQAKRLTTEGDCLIQAAAKAQGVVLAGQIQLAPISQMAEIYGRLNAIIEPVENRALEAKAFLEASAKRPQIKLTDNSSEEAPQKRPRLRVSPNRLCL
ncbi:MAG: hypothetical protein EBY16_03390 [Gammaproteobacteria bacterium]|nr:hypothetical protein [Gammaproteobacteria bacterium]